MSEVIEVESFFILVEEISKIASKLNNLQLRIKLRLNENSRYDSMHHIFLIRELLNMRTTINELINDLMGSHLSDPSLAVNYIWDVIESNSRSPETVVEGTRLIERFFKLKMHSMIKPTDYLNTIAAYVQWQNETVLCFVDRFNRRSRDTRLDVIVHMWDWNYRANEKMFFGGAARPLHLKKVTEFSALMSIYYDALWPIYKENRNCLVEALTTLLRQESSIFWPNYEVFPCINSSTIIDKCLQYFFFKDRKNTWFINSSASDYIPFVKSAREIFAEKFIGSHMTHPNQHNTEWISNDLKQHCSNIYEQHQHQNHENKPTIIILLTSKNRLGHRIEVDFIHSELCTQFPTVVTIVDACQDGQSFREVDIIIYSKRFTTIGAIGLVNKSFLEKNTVLRKKLTVSASFPVGIVAQVYINVNMANTGLVCGVEDLTNSSRWKFSQCPIQRDLHDTIDYLYVHQDIVEHWRGPILYSFTEDLIGTIIVLTAGRCGQQLLPKLWALLKKQGHSLDCFVMDNPYLKSDNAVYTHKVQELIERKFIDELRQIEVLSSDYLIWPLVPYWVTSPDDISIERLQEHFNVCYDYHCCLRISFGRCGYPGKFKRLIEHIDDIIQRDELNVSDDILGKHASQWPS